MPLAAHISQPRSRAACSGVWGKVIHSLTLSRDGFDPASMPPTARNIPLMLGSRIIVQVLNPPAAWFQV